MMDSHKKAVRQTISCKCQLWTHARPNPDPTLNPILTTLDDHLFFFSHRHLPSIVKCLWEVFGWGFGVLFLSCACVCRCRGCCSLSVCVRDLLNFYIDTCPHQDGASTAPSNTSPFWT